MVDLMGLCQIQWCLFGGLRFLLNVVDKFILFNGKEMQCLCGRQDELSLFQCIEVMWSVILIESFYEGEIKFLYDVDRGFIVGFSYSKYYFLLQFFKFECKSSIGGFCGVIFFLVVFNKMIFQIVVLIFFFDGFGDQF